MIILTEAQRAAAGQHALNATLIAEQHDLEDQFAGVINFLNEIYWSGAER